jgi:hypothetical protein
MYVVYSNPKEPICSAWRGDAIFAKDFPGLPARKISKNYSTTNAFCYPDSFYFTFSTPQMWSLVSQ